MKKNILTSNILPSELLQHALESTMLLTQKSTYVYRADYFHHRNGNKTHISLAGALFSKAYDLPKFLNLDRMDVFDDKVRHRLNFIHYIVRGEIYPWSIKIAFPTSKDVSQCVDERCDDLNYQNLDEAILYGSIIRDNLQHLGA